MRRIRRLRGVAIKAPCLTSVLVVASTLSVLASGSALRAETTAGTWTASSPLNTGRVGHTLTHLHGPACGEATPPSYCGKALVAGGREAMDGAALASAELYDPETRRWEQTGDLVVPRSGHTATLLGDGTVLVAGGRDASGKPIASAEIFAPTLFRLLPSGKTAQGAWVPTGALVTARAGHTATLLSGGRVLVTGGVDASGKPVAHAEVFDPTAERGLGAWKATAAMDMARAGHTATLLVGDECTAEPVQDECGKVLVAGGVDASGAPLSRAEVFDPRADGGAGAWQVTAPMAVPRSSHAAAPLDRGRALVVGGGTAEVFDPAADGGAGRWYPTGPTIAGRSGHTATRLHGPACERSHTCGHVLVAGGSGASGRDFATAELFDPASGRWRPTGSLIGARSGHGGALLATGEVVVAGGAGVGGALRSAEVFDPGSSQQPPSISGVSPSVGPLSGRGVVITGIGFAGTTAVSFGDKRAVGFTVDAAGKRITATSPPHAPGTVDVRVTTPVGTSAAIDVSRFTYAPPPAVTALNPIAGPSAGGTEVTVSGTDLGFPETSVQFGGVAATDVRVVSSTEVVAVAPPHPPGDVHVVVTTPAGTSQRSFATRFSYGDGTWSATGTLAHPRYLHSATLLPNGTVLVAGGTVAYDHAGPTLATAELYDPAAGVWTPTGELNDRRYSHTATLLDGPKCRSALPPSYCGKVLVAGGERHEPGPPGVSPFVAVGSSELYDPKEGVWTLTKGRLDQARFSHTATLLDGPECRTSAPPSHCGKVLVTGGSIDELGRLPVDTSELYDPETETWAPTGALDADCTQSSSRYCGRTNHTATMLPDGKVLVAGGIGSDPVGRPASNLNLVSNMAEITVLGGADGPDASARSATVTHTVVRPYSGAFPVLGVLLSAAPDPAATVAPGDEVTYTLAYFNSGRAAAKDAVVVDSLPDGVEFVRASGGEYDYDEASHTVRFRPVAVPVETTGSRPAGVFQITVKVKSPPGGGDVITNTAQIDSGLSNTVRHRIGSFHPTSPLGVVLSANPPPGAPVSPGDHITYSLSYFNTSDAEVTATVVSGPLPEMVDFVSLKRNGAPATCVNCSFNTTTRTFTVSPATVPPGTTADRPADTFELTLVVHPRVNDPGPVFLNTAEVYDPGAGTWARTKPMVVPRFGHTATLLEAPACGEHCGTVLVVGGAERLAPNEPVFTGSAELYDPAKGEWRSAHALRHPRAGHTATLLPDGQVLVAGSSMVFPHQGLPPRLASAEVFDPLRSEWRDTSPMLTARGIHTATLLDGQVCAAHPSPDHCGTVLVAGGGGSGTTVEDPVTPSAVRDAERYRSGVRPPTVLNVTPTDGPSAGGRAVVVAGGGFTGVSAVRFGDVPAKSFQVESRGLITAVAPQHPKGTVDVTVIAGGGTSSPTPGSRFTYKVSQPPGRVTDLRASVVSGSEIELAFSAPPSDGSFPPPAERFVVKQATAPIVGEAAFAAATTLCEAQCRFSPRAVGDKLSLAVADLGPGTEYHYALRAVNEIGQEGAISNSASATTPSRASATGAVEATTTTSTTSTPSEAETLEEETLAAPRTGPRNKGQLSSPAAALPAPPGAAISPVAAPVANPPTEPGENRLSSPPDPLPPVEAPRPATSRSTWRTALLWGLALLLMAALGGYLNRRYRPLPTPGAARDGCDR